MPSAAPRTLTRKELTAAHAARQLLIERADLSPIEAIRQLTPLQAQDPPSPYIGLAARIKPFDRAVLEQAFSRHDVIKTTINRITLHAVCAEDYLAYHVVTAQPRLRFFAKLCPDTTIEEAGARLAAFAAEPRENSHIRAHMVEHHPQIPHGEDQLYQPLLNARALAPLRQLPPAGHWKRKDPIQFMADPRPLPSLADAATHVVRQYLGAFGPATKKDIASWAGCTQRDFAAAFERLDLVTYADEQGATLYDLPGLPLPPASTKLPPRFLGRWDQALLSHHDRARVMDDEVRKLKLTLSGDMTVLVDGRVAASWKLNRSASVTQVELQPHVAIPRRAHAAIRAEAKLTARFCVPEVERVEVAGL